jgi:putative spermidine/putrescine transport system substrate-binding protein
VVLSAGGRWEEANRKAIWEPFSQETGVTVVPTVLPIAQIVASVQQGRSGVDVINAGFGTMLTLERAGALDRLDPDAMKRFSMSDIDAVARRDFMLGNAYFATVMAYRTDAFATGSHPRSWLDFWDVQKFPGARSLAHPGTNPELELALIADGVPARTEALYPLDVERALRSLGRIRKSIVKFWDSPALSAQLLERKEAVLMSIVNGNVQNLIDKGLPVAIEWNQAERRSQWTGIPKSAASKANAQLFIDYSMQPKVQAELTRFLPYGPTNRQAMKLVRPEDARKLPSHPEHYAMGWDIDERWWAENRPAVIEKFQAWSLSG